MLDISKSIKNLDNVDIEDNLLYYDYNIKHLKKLIDKGLDRNDPAFISAYRSFEGEVFENFIYEKLLRYALSCDEIKYFILKGYHQNQFVSKPNTLSISEKQQIVYRTKSREISEFDAMFITKDNELYFVEMTLVKSVVKLNRRLRKKKALLETIFPNYTIKALVILNEGVSGVRAFPDYVKIWKTKPFDAKKVLDYLLSPNKRKLKPKKIIRSKKMIEADTLKLYPFRYYNTLTWITKKLREDKNNIINFRFLYNYKTQRYHNLYNKFYIGYIDLSEVKELLKLGNEFDKNQKVVVALEKKFNDEIVLTYYIQTSRKKLWLYGFNDEGELSVEQKDPYGITVTEVYHISRIFDESYRLSFDDITKLQKELKRRFLKYQSSKESCKDSK